jgi:hypothetical protein
MMKTMIDKNSMKEISTMNELRLLRRQLKRQIRYTEENIENEYYTIIYGYKTWLVQKVLRKSIILTLGFLAKKLTRRH